MKKLIAFFTVFMFMINVAPCVRADAVSFQPPFQVNSESAVLYNLDTKTVIYEKNSGMSQAPAQLVQIMTAVICLENVSNLDDTVACQEAVFTEFASYRDEYPDIFIPVSNFEVDEELTMRSLLYAMMLESSTEAAGTIAYHVGNGSTKGFVEMMNKKAKDIGCENTNFTNPHGLYDPKQLTTALDMTKILEYALSIDEFEKIATTSVYEMPATNVHTEPWEITHTNAMTVNDTEYYYPAARGIKTGYSDETGRTLAVKASQDGTNHILILLNAPVNNENGKAWYSHFEDARQIFEWAFKNLSYRTILRTDEESQEAAVAFSADNDYVILKPYEGYKVLWDNTVSVSFIEKETEVIENVTAPVMAGDVLGRIKLIYNGEEIFATDLVASADVELSKSKYWSAVTGGFFKSKWFKLALLFGFILSFVYVAYYIYQYRIMMDARKRAIATRTQNPQRRRPPQKMNGTRSAQQRKRPQNSQQRRRPANAPARRSQGTQQRRPQGTRPPQKKTTSTNTDKKE